MHIYSNLKITHIFLFGAFMSKWKSAENEQIRKALLMHGVRLIAKLLKLCLFIHA